MGWSCSAAHSAGRGAHGAWYCDCVTGGGGARWRAAGVCVRRAAPPCAPCSCCATPQAPMYKWCTSTGLPHSGVAVEEGLTAGNLAAGAASGKPWDGPPGLPGPQPVQLSSQEVADQLELLVHGLVEKGVHPLGIGQHALHEGCTRSQRMWPRRLQCAPAPPPPTGPRRVERRGVQVPVDAAVWRARAAGGQGAARPVQLRALAPARVVQVRGRRAHQVQASGPAFFWAHACGKQWQTVLPWHGEGGCA